jgi:hypothetical protein
VDEIATNGEADSVWIFFLRPVIGADAEVSLFPFGSCDFLMKNNVFVPFVESAFRPLQRRANSFDPPLYHL